MLTAAGGGEAHRLYSALPDEVMGKTCLRHTPPAQGPQSCPRAEGLVWLLLTVGRSPHLWGAQSTPWLQS